MVQIHSGRREKKGLRMTEFSGKGFKVTLGWLLRRLAKPCVDEEKMEEVP